MCSFDGVKFRKADLCEIFLKFKPSYVCVPSQSARFQACVHSLEALWSSLEPYIKQTFFSVWKYVTAFSGLFHLNSTIQG